MAPSSPRMDDSVAMLAIRSEIDAIAAGTIDVEQSPLRHAPHPAADLIAPLERPYTAP